MSGTVDILTETVESVVAIPIQAVTVRDFNRIRRGRNRAGRGEAAEDGREDEEQEAFDEEEAEDDAPAASAALGEEDLRKVVFLFREGRARIREVETGIADDTHIEIKSGVEEGQTVIVGPYSAVSRDLRPGAPVQVRERNRPRPGGPPAEE